MVSKLFDVKHQLVFYGKYHSNKYNVAIHMVFVPIILWTATIMLSNFRLPDTLVPQQSISILEPYLRLEPTCGALFAVVYGLYYLTLDPVAAVLYWPILSLMVLTGAPIAETNQGNIYALSLFATAWVAQFAGHGFAEKRAPALLDNLLGAVVLAPFFVHLEILFKLGYRPKLHKEVVNGIGVEVAKFRKEQGDGRRAKAKELWIRHRKS